MNPVPMIALETSYFLTQESIRLRIEYYGRSIISGNGVLRHLARSSSNATE